MLKMQVDTKDLQRLLARMPAVMKEEVGDGLDHASRKLLQVFAQRRLSALAWHQSSASQGVVKNRGGFFRGFKRIFSFSSSQGGMGVTVFTPSKLAKAQEEGFTAGGGQGVPVPLSAAASEVMTAKGRVKKSLWNLDRKKNIRPIKFKGQVYLTKVFKGPMEREVQPLFVIKPQVKVEPHLGYYDTFESMKPQLFQILAKSIIKGVKRASENG